MIKNWLYNISLKNEKFFINTSKDWNLSIEENIHKKYSENINMNMKLTIDLNINKSSRNDQISTIKLHISFFSFQIEKFFWIEYFTISHPKVFSDNFTIKQYPTITKLNNGIWITCKHFVSSFHFI